jgi:hypothetical protein
MGKIQKIIVIFELMTEIIKTCQKFSICPLNANSFGKSTQMVPITVHT